MIPETRRDSYYFADGTMCGIFFTSVVAGLISSNWFFAAALLVWIASHSTTRKE